MFASPKLNKRPNILKRYLFWQNAIKAVLGGVPPDSFAMKILNASAWHLEVGVHLGKCAHHTDTMLPKNMGRVADDVKSPKMWSGHERARTETKVIHSWPPWCCYDRN